MTINKDIHIF